MNKNAILILGLVLILWPYIEPYIPPPPPQPVPPVPVPPEPNPPIPPQPVPPQPLYPPSSIPAFNQDAATNIAPLFSGREEMRLDVADFCAAFANAGLDNNPNRPNNLGEFRTLYVEAAKATLGDKYRGAIPNLSTAIDNYLLRCMGLARDETGTVPNSSLSPEKIRLLSEAFKALAHVLSTRTESYGWGSSTIGNGTSLYSLDLPRLRFHTNGERRLSPRNLHLS